MPFRWLLDRHPEIAHLHRARRRALLHAANWQLRNDRRIWLAYVPLTFLPLAGILISNWVPLGIRTHGAYWLGFGLVLAAGLLLQARVRHAALRDALRDELLSQDIRPARCFDCGYDLRSIGGDRCPECGAALRRP
jgi:hypothetical protein